MCSLILNGIGDYLVLDLEFCKTVSEYGYILTYTISLQNVLSRFRIDLEKCQYNKHMNSLKTTYPCSLGSTLTTIHHSISTNIYTCLYAHRT